MSLTTYNKLIDFYLDHNKETRDDIVFINLNEVKLNIEFIQDYVLDFHPKIKPLYFYTHKYIYFSSFIDGFIDLDFFPLQPDRSFPYQFHIGNHDEYKHSLLQTLGSAGVPDIKEKYETLRCIKTRT
jgi:hypothetical protein